jgi:glycosyltransferase involved in cell wall biosynthesis
MKILFDLSATQPENGIINHGGSEYAKAVFFKLIESCPKSVSVYYNRNLALEKPLVELIQEHSLFTLESNDIKFICSYISANRINVFYTALPKKEHVLLIKMQSESFKVIITIHGLRSLELPSDNLEWYYCKSVKSKLKYIYKRLFPSFYKTSLLKYYRMILGASEIITVSNHSKYSLLTFFPELQQEKILVYYSPLISYISDTNSGENIIEKLSLSNRKYFLLISGSLWTKNSYRAIRAFDQLISYNHSYIGYKMVVTGMLNPYFKVKNPGNFVFTNYLNRESLEELFKNALSLVYPTLNEGFGYPPLEAMKYGVPVLASGIGPISEVCSNAAYYFNPENETGIMIKLLFAIIDKDLFSDVNMQIRYNRHKLIMERQESDLIQLIRLLTEQP